MKVGLVLPSPPKYSETFLNSLISILQQEGIDVTVFSGEKVKGKYPYKCVSAREVNASQPFRQFFRFVFIFFKTIVRAPGKSFRLFQLERTDSKSISNSLKNIYLNSHILQQKLDWLHFGFATMTLQRENVAKAAGAKMSVSLRGFDINIFPLKKKNCYSGMWKKVDKVHTISDYLHSKAIELGLPKDTPFEKIAPAIDTRFWKMNKTSWKIHTPVRIFTAGRLNWVKDFETAISTMAVLRDSGLDFIYNIAGEGKEHERLSYAVHQLNLGDKVFFLGKHAHKDILKLMTESDIYLQTSLQEGFCVSVLEAQAAGIICIVSDADGLKENVIDNVTGYVVPRRNPGLFAKKIIEVTEMQEEQRKQIAESARRRVVSDFDISLQQKKFRKFFYQ